MAKSNITVTIKIKWWFLYLYWPLLKGFLYLARLINPDIEPNWGKLEYWLKRAVVFKT